MKQELFIIALCDISDNFTGYSKTETNYGIFKILLKQVLLYERKNKSVVVSTNNANIRDRISNALGTRDIWRTCIKGEYYYNVYFTIPLFNNDTGKKVSVGYLISRL